MVLYFEVFGLMGFFFVLINFLKIINSIYINCFRVLINFIFKFGMFGSLKKNIIVFEKNKLIKEIFIIGLYYIFIFIVSEMNGNNL